MLTVGTKAPDFTLPDQNGIMHSLSEYSGKKVLLYFYPKDNTSGCSKQAASYSEKIAEFDKKNVTVVGISKDSVASHKKFESNYDLKFTLLSDTDRTVIEAYDIWKEKKLYGKTSMGVVRTTFVISPDGKIEKIMEKVKPDTNAGDILAYLRENP